MYIPKTVLDVTVKDQNGKEVFSRQKEYAIYDLYFAGGKQVPLKDWDITAMKRIDQSIHSLETDSHTFVVPLSEGIKSVDVEVSFSYIYERGKTATIAKVSKKIEFKKK